MAKLNWGGPGEREFELGVDRGVLYPKVGSGIAWSGLISVSESDTGGDPTAFYLDGIKFQEIPKLEEYGATIEAFTYPDEFGRIDGSIAIANGLFATQQRRQQFGFSYRTKIGNDLNGMDHGYKIHLVYNALASPSERGNKSMSDSSDVVNFSWNITATPVFVAGAKPSAHFIIDSTDTEAGVLSAIEEALYGSSISEPRLPTPAELVDIYLDAVPELEFTVTGPDLNGVFTISGPDSMVKLIDSKTFQLNAPEVTLGIDGQYTATSA